MLARAFYNIEESEAATGKQEAKHNEPFSWTALRILLHPRLPPLPRILQQRTPHHQQPGTFPYPYPYAKTSVCSLLLFQTAARPLYKTTIAQKYI